MDIGSMVVHHIRFERFAHHRGQKKAEDTLKWIKENW
jgi:hypothetical protein